MTEYINQSMPNREPYSNRLLFKRASLQDISVIAELINALPISGRYSILPFGGQLAYIKHIIESSLGIVVIGIDPLFGKGVGYVIAITESKRFWYTFIIKYPFYTGLLFLKKFLDKIKLKARNKAASSFRWSQACEKSARIIFIGVLPEYRGLGIGQRIYQLLFEILKEEGRYLVEAHIDKDNEPSIRLHKKVGFEIEQLNSGDYRAYKTLKVMK